MQHVLIVFGSLWTSFPIDTAIVDRACNADDNNKPHGGRLLVDVLPPQLLLLWVDPL